MRFRTPPCNRTWPPGPLGPGCTPSAMPESSSSMPRRRQRFRVTCVLMPRRQSAGNQSPVRVAFADRCSSRGADLRIRPRRSRRSLPRARLGASARSWARRTTHGGGAAPQVRPSPSAGRGTRYIATPRRSCRGWPRDFDRLGRRHGMVVSTMLRRARVHRLQPGRPRLGPGPRAATAGRAQSESGLHAAGDSDTGSTHRRGRPANFGDLAVILEVVVGGAVA